MIALVPVTPQNRARFEGLVVASSQEDLLADTVPWLDEALDEPHTQTFGVIAQDKPAGLASLMDTRDAPPELYKEAFQQGCAYLWRFLIDADAQGRGLGRMALTALEQEARGLSATGLSLTTADKIAGNALGFYTRMGYAPTGRRLGGEIELVKRFEEACNA